MLLRQELILPVIFSIELILFVNFSSSCEFHSVEDMADRQPGELLFLIWDLILIAKDREMLVLMDKRAPEVGSGIQ